MNLYRLKKAKKVISTILIIYLSFVTALYLAQRKMIYFPDREVAALPDIPNLSIDVMNVTTDDDVLLRGWHVQAAKDKPTIVFFHGNASRHEASLWKSLPFIENDGYGFLSIGYRGYGGNEGKPSEQGFYKDSRAFIDALIKSGLSEDNIILYGQSIGTGVAVQMAAEFPNARAMILESPYTSLVDVAAAKYFFVPVRFLLKDRFDSLSKISDIKIRTLIIHGRNDRIIPFKYGQKLYDTANDPKKFIALEGVGHNDIPRERVYDEVINFLKEN